MSTEQYGCGICLETGVERCFPSVWDVEQHIKVFHFGKRVPSLA